MDSLSFKHSNSYKRIYDQGDKPILWVVSASEKYALVPYYWKFPLLGKVSYKGFFIEEFAEHEKNRLMAEGFDVSIRSVSAWSTLGWLNDPVLSSHLDKTTGDFCNLLFHELFHTTYYKPSSVEENENLASFIADKATLQFLRHDTVALYEYIRDRAETDSLLVFLNHKSIELKALYTQMNNDKNKLIIKRQFFVRFANDLKRLDGVDLTRLNKIIVKSHIEQNAFFIDYMQYNSKRDSLEFSFNKIYKGSLKSMVQSLSKN